MYTAHIDLIRLSVLTTTELIRFSICRFYLLCHRIVLPTQCFEEQLTYAGEYTSPEVLIAQAILAILLAYATHALLCPRVCTMLLIH